ncbi:fungal specific transcription factor domain-containing protein [Sarocladium implicatum]|nr:fungal specific transcription factor domain-containing protein [Sarocladium implicatum]
MTNASSTRPKQRTKAGCLVCRQKRKKCDEKLPVCDRCQRSGSKCQWPSSAELVDRRFASHSEFRHRKSARHDQSEPAHVASEPSFVLEADAAHKLISRDIEAALSLHFDTEYAQLILPPGGHPKFFDKWAGELHVMRIEFKAFSYAALACSASHLHHKNLSGQMQELALTYYSHAIRQLAQLLASNAAGIEHHNGVIMAILTLCMHGSTGRGTTSDMERHVAAVTKLLSLRIQADPSVIGRPFDRLGVECTLHQVFLVGTGLWSDVERSSPSGFLDFWVFTEALLDQSNLYVHKPEGFRTPVVGIPASLLRMSLALREQFRRPWHIDQATIDSVRPWTVFWEKISDQLTDAVTHAEEKLTLTDQIREDTSHLYALVTSILFEQLTRGNVTPAGLPWPVSGHKWQIQRAMSILQRNNNNDRWTCYSMCDWVVYTLGLLVSATEDMECVRWDMQRRWNLSKFSQAMRFWKDLEAIWSARTSPQSTPSESQAYVDDRESHSGSSTTDSQSPPEQKPNVLAVRLRQPTVYAPASVVSTGLNHPQVQYFGQPLVPAVNAYGKT